ncbi:MAG TPA: hypothetical protein PLV32_13130, partial [Chitinophagaceae bacterium]|nr:hypothetical protein [Chitinophagaceae bacterium]
MFKSITFNDKTTMMKKVPLIIIVFLCTMAVTEAQKTYIWCGVLIDGISDAPLKDRTIVVEKDRIIAVENGFTKPGVNDKLVDLKTKTVTPGWIDMHVHLESETRKGNTADRF